MVDNEGTPDEKRYIEINTDHPQFQTLAEHGRKDPDWGKVEVITYLSEEVVKHVARTIGGNNLTEVDKHQDDGIYKLWELLRKHGAYSTISIRPDAESKTKKKKK